MAVGKLIDPAGDVGDGAHATTLRAALSDESPLYLFSARLRRSVVVYVGVAAAVSLVVGQFVHGEDSFLLAWAVTAGFGMVPAAIAVRFAAQRSVGPYRDFWRLWFLGLIAAILCLIGVGVAVATRSDAVRAIAGLSAMATVPIWGVATGRLLRARSGRRSFGVDVLDVVIALVVVVAPAVLVVLGPALASSAPWFTVPALVAACVLPASIVAAGVLYLRTPAGHRAAEGVGLVMGSLSTVNAWLLVGQGVSNFTMPASLQLAVQAFDMGLLLAGPVFCHRGVVEGLDRLSAAGQVRRWSPAPVLVALGVPVLVAATWILHDQLSWAFMYSTLVFAILLGLATIRHALMVRETRRLYREIERVSEERKLLLSSLMRAVEQDRHRVAAQLHGEALGSLAALGMIMQTSCSALPPDVAAPFTDALSDIRAGLTERAESLRELMLAVRPPELDDDSLATSFLALVGELYGETMAPNVVIDVDPQLVLDWTTKTIVYRIAHEAIHNTWRHAQASRLDISLRWTDGAIVFTADDDGVGFDPDDRIESGIATMRLFAGLGQGTVAVERRVEGGMRVRAVLGQHDAVVADDHPPPRRLQVIRGDARQPVTQPSIVTI